MGHKGQTSGGLTRGGVRREERGVGVAGKGDEDMTKQRPSSTYGLILMLFLAAPMVGCTPLSKVTTGAFTQVSRLESELQRGVSGKMDVQRVLGTPKGFGHTVLPINQKPHEVWYYDDIEMTDITGEGIGGFRAQVRQQILLVFFEQEKGVFNGFMWFSNTGRATGE